MSTNNWQFHFRNFTHNEAPVQVNHPGCGMVPWREGRPACWKKDIPYNPTGGSQSVYAPSDWVVNFGEWFEVIEDGLKFIAHLGIFILSEGEDVEALIDGLVDVFNIEKDIVTAALDKLSPDQLADLIDQASKAFPEQCQQINVKEEDICSYAKKMGMSDGWAFISGTTYHDYIHQSSVVTGKYGWSIFYTDPNGVVRLANAMFIADGHLFPVIADGMENKLWTKFD